jgi:probable HAF family extracellular repeat protein
MRVFLLLIVAMNAYAGEALYRVALLEPRGAADFYQSTEPRAINNLGTVAGVFYRTWPYPAGTSGTGMFIHSPESGFEEIGHYEGMMTQPYHINERGQITVSARAPNIELALRYTPGVGFERIGSFEEIRASALSINSHGTLVGTTDTQGATHAFLYSDNEGMVDLGTFGGIYASAGGINDQGYVVGFTTFEEWDPADEVFYRYNMAYRWQGSEGVTFLGRGKALRINEKMTVLLEGDEWGPEIILRGERKAILAKNWVWPGMGMALNDADVIVGGGGDYKGSWFNWPQPTGYVWAEMTGVQNLQHPTFQDSGWWITGAWGINNVGQIAAEAWFVGKRRAVRLDPIAPRLRVRASATNAAISWFPAWPGVFLESTESLAEPNWERVSLLETNEISLPLTSAARFFRLNVTALEGLCCGPEPEREVRHAPDAYSRIQETRLAEVFRNFAGWPPSLVIARAERPRDLVFEGGGFDLNDDLLSFEWSILEDNGWRSFASARWATNRFERFGRHEVQLRVSDGELAGTNTLTFDMITPGEFLWALSEAIEAHPDRGPGADAFNAMLNAAAERLDQGDEARGLEVVNEALSLLDTEQVLFQQHHGPLGYFLQTFIWMMEQGAI